MQALHYASFKNSGTDVAAHLISEYKVEPWSKTRVCEMLPTVPQCTSLYQHQITMMHA